MDKVTNLPSLASIWAKVPAALAIWPPLPGLSRQNNIFCPKKNWTQLFIIIQLIKFCKLENFPYKLKINKQTVSVRNKNL